MSRTTYLALSAIAVATLTATSAFASQGPGIMPGTLAPYAQTAMAVAVYGASALIVAAGLIGGLRRY